MGARLGDQNTGTYLIVYTDSIGHRSAPRFGGNGPTAIINFVMYAPSNIFWYLLEELRGML